jgi:hypothetical protein
LNPEANVRRPFRRRPMPGLAAMKGEQREGHGLRAEAGPRCGRARDILWPRSWCARTGHLWTHRRRARCDLSHTQKKGRPCAKLYVRTGHDMISRETCKTPESPAIARAGNRRARNPKDPGKRQSGRPLNRVCGGPQAPPRGAEMRPLCAPGGRGPQPPYNTPAYCRAPAPGAPRGGESARFYHAGKENKKGRSFGRAPPIKNFFFFPKKKPPQRKTRPQIKGGFFFGEKEKKKWGGRFSLSPGREKGGLSRKK